MELLQILEDWEQSQQSHISCLETAQERLEQEIGDPMGEQAYGIEMEQMENNHANN
jgi:hypothetical protein